MSDPVTVPLSKPITAHGEEVAALTLQPPTTRQIIELGLPTLIVTNAGGDVGLEVRTQVVARYVSRLAAIPMSSVEALAPADFSACTGAVMGFFGESGAVTPPS